jgi:hypothetical protein
MARVMINCPVKKVPVWTQTGLTKEAFENPTIQMVGNTFGPCPACGGRHTWDKKDAFLEAEPKK